MPKRSTLRLTTRSVAALPVTGKDAVYWDRDLAGFGVRVQRNGRKVYVVQSRGLCCKPDVGMSQIRTTTVLSS